MSSRGPVASLVVVVVALAALALPLLALADADPAPQTRATIRGTGKDVSIVYRGIPSPAAPRGASGAAGVPAASPSSDVVSEATRLAARGTDDRSLINYLRTHESALPDIVGADAVRKLRKAGAGPEVISELSRMTALDIGETAEGAPAQNLYANEAPPSYGTEYSSADMGYPFYGSYGGYGGYGSAGFPRRHGGRNFASPHHSTLPARPTMPGMHGGPARPPMHAGEMHAGSFRVRP